MKIHLAFIVFCLLCMAAVTNAQGWRKLTLPEIDSTARTIQFVDSLNGWVLADRQLFLTTDGGDSWIRKVYPVNRYLVNGQLLDNNSGAIAMSDEGPIYSHTSPIIQPNIYLFDLQTRSFNWMYQMPQLVTYYTSAFSNNKTFELVGSSLNNFYTYVWHIQYVHSTYDSTRLPSGHPFPVGGWVYSDVRFRDTLVGYITARQMLAPGLLPWGLVLKTLDGGKTWADDTVMYAGGFIDVEFTDSSKGYISALTNYTYDDILGRWYSKSALRYTTDGGSSWIYADHIFIRRGTFLSDTTFLCLSREYYAWTKDGVLYRSTLKKNSARSEIVFDKTPLQDFCALSANRIWLLAKDGNTIYRLDPLLNSVAQTASTPEAPTLSRNYPNPFHSITTFTFTIPDAMSAKLVVYDLHGREMSVLVDGLQSRGTHTVTFDGSGLRAGVYLCRLMTPVKVVETRMTIVK